MAICFSTEIHHDPILEDFFVFTFAFK